MIEKQPLSSVRVFCPPASTVTPDYEAITSFQKGQASRIFKEVNEQDKVLIVSKQNKPQNVVISYERYKRLREEGADI